MLKKSHSLNKFFCNVILNWLLLPLFFFDVDALDDCSAETTVVVDTVLVGDDEEFGTRLDAEEVAFIIEIGGADEARGLGED
jgi:hypothetical protein